MWAAFDKTTEAGVIHSNDNAEQNSDCYGSQYGRSHGKGIRVLVRAQRRPLVDQRNEVKCLDPVSRSKEFRLPIDGQVKRNKEEEASLPGKRNGTVKRMPEYGVSGSLSADHLRSIVVMLSHLIRALSAIGRVTDFAR